MWGWGWGGQQGWEEWNRLRHNSTTPPTHPPPPAQAWTQEAPSKPSLESPLQRRPDFLQPAGLISPSERDQKRPPHSNVTVVIRPHHPARRKDWTHLTDGLSIHLASSGGREQGEETGGGPWGRRRPATVPPRLEGGPGPSPQISRLIPADLGQEKAGRLGTRARGPRPGGEGFSSGWAPSSLHPWRPPEASLGSGKPSTGAGPWASRHFPRSPRVP